MKNGFVKVACATPELKVADVSFNIGKILDLCIEAERRKVKILVFPELCITGYTAGDLFYHKTLLDAAENGLKKIADATCGQVEISVNDSKFFMNED